MNIKLNIKAFLIASTVALSPSCSGTQPSSGPDVSADVQIVQVDALRKIFLEDSHWDEETEVWSYAKGEVAEFQFVVRCDSPVSDLKVETDGLMCGSSVIKPFRKAFETYVVAGKHLEPAGSAAVFPASDKYPDCLKEVASTKVAASVNQPVWVSFSIPKDALAGRYEATLTFSGKVGDGTFSIERKLGADVRNVTLAEQELLVSNWHNHRFLSLLKNGSNVPMFSDSYWELLTIMAHTMRDSGQNVYYLDKLLDYVECELNGDTWTFDFANFDKAVGIFMKEGNLKRIEGGHIAHRLGEWESAYGVYIPNRTDVVPLSSREAEIFLPQFSSALEKHLQEKGWAGIYLQHIGDEPCDANASTYVDVARVFRQNAPSLRILDAVHSHALADVVDVWCPELDYFHSGYEFYKERQAAGDELWFYTCMAPRGEYANRFLELPLIHMRILHWLNYKYGATGYLHWGFNQDWTKTGQGIATDGYCPGGDTYIVYPAYKKVYSSIRLESMRDGINDYTLLTMLGKKNPDKAREIVDAVVLGMDRYNLGIRFFRETREKMLEALEQ